MRFQVFLPVLFFVGVVWACSIPVYRYAIAQWATDPYEVLIFAKGDLSPAQKKTIAEMTEAGSKTAVAEKAKVKNTSVGSFYKVSVHSPDDSVAKSNKQLMAAGASLPFPWVAVMFPNESKIPVPLWMGALDSMPVKYLSTSPARKTIYDRLTKGTTAVWILLESGDKSKDKTAEKTLENSLKVCKDSLKLPEITKIDRAQMGKIAEGLGVTFSVVKVSRTDPQEQTLVKVLISSERGLGAFEKEPMAFPIFGRGRLLYALVGKGINTKNIMQANAFLTGSCSCTIKEQNPGKDVLMTYDWGPIVKTSVDANDNDLPQLGSLSSGQCLAKKDSVSAKTNGPRNQ